MVGSSVSLDLEHVLSPLRAQRDAPPDPNPAAKKENLGEKEMRVPKRRWVESSAECVLLVCCFSPLHGQLQEGSQWRPQHPEQAWPRQALRKHIRARGHGAAGPRPLASRKGTSPSHLSLGSVPGGSVVKNLPAVQETQVRFLGREHPLEKGMATYSSILAW